MDHIFNLGLIYLKSHVAGGTKSGIFGLHCCQVPHNFLDLIIISLATPIEHEKNKCQMGPEVDDPEISKNFLVCPIGVVLMSKCHLVCIPVVCSC